MIRGALTWRDRVINPLVVLGILTIAPERGARTPTRAEAIAIWDYG
jgi:hypothetical protein